MANIKFNKIGKVYGGGVRAVTDFDLEINHEEFIVIVGPSGCGKSTVLRMIAGLEDITEGELLIDGKIVNDMEPKDRDIAMVFQNYALYPHMSVYENMAFGLKIRKTEKSEVDERVKGAAAILGIEELLGRKPKALSGGQRQRVALGRAIVRSPKVFLMDEPLSNLDAKLRVQTRAEIVKLHKRLGTTFIYVTHDQTEAMTMGDRIVVMKDGFIQQYDSPKNLYERPINRFVASFIGSPQMNFGEMQAVDTNGEVRLDFQGINTSIPVAVGTLLRQSGYVGKSMILGIRPEDVHLAGDEAKGVFTGLVDAVEDMGSDKYLFIKSGFGAITLRTGRDIERRVGEEVKFRFSGEKLHLFDGETGLRIQEKHQKSERS